MSERQMMLLALMAGPVLLIVFFVLGNVWFWLPFVLAAAWFAFWIMKAIIKG